MRHYNVSIAVSAKEKTFIKNVTFLSSNLRELDEKLRVYANENDFRFDLISIAVAPDYDYQPLPF